MSATLGGGLAQDLQSLMSANLTQSNSSSNSSSSSSNSSSTGVPVVVSEGRSYPVTTHYLGRPCRCLSLHVVEQYITFLAWWGCCN